MEKKSQFIEKINASYTTQTPAIYLGAGILDGEIIAEAEVNLSLKMMNRHGLIAGATGTGKTRTLQLIAEQLSDAGVPVFVADIKGDLSGLGAAGDSSERVTTRAKETGYAWQPSTFPVEFLSLTGAKGAQ